MLTLPFMMREPIDLPPIVSVELIEIKVLFSLTSLSPIREERPLPKPFFGLKGFIMLHSPLVYLDLKIHQ